MFQHKLAIEVIPTGSYHICNPPVMDTDIDYLVYVESKNWNDFDSDLVGNKWEFLGSEPEDCDAATSNDSFKSYKKGKINLIATANIEFFNNFKLASHVAKQLNLLSKSDRIILFQAILYGNTI